MSILIGIVVFLLKVAMVLSGIAMYVKGECDTKFLGKSNKNWKYMMGIPIALLGALAAWSFIPFIAMLTYFIACELGYGENNPLTKMVGQHNAIMIHGAAVGLASFPIIGWWAILAGAISGWAFGYIHTMDDAGKIKEPFVAIARGIAGCLLLLK